MRTASHSGIGGPVPGLISIDRTWIRGHSQHVAMVWHYWETFVGARYLCGHIRDRLARVFHVWLLISGLDQYGCVFCGESVGFGEFGLA